MLKTNRFHLSIEHLWGLIALAGIFVFVNTHPIRPYDFWWHITIGREILNNGSIPAVDIYSYTANGQPYPSYQMFWLMDILYYWIYRLGGPALVVFIQSLMITSAYFIIFWICRRTSNSWRIGAFSVLFAAALGLNDWNVRPQGITFLLASLYLLAIFEFQKTNQWKWLVLFPIGMLIWVNSHGTFLIGIALVGLWLCQELWNMFSTRKQNDSMDRADRRLIAPGIALVLTTLTCLVNPRGLGILTYIKTLTGNSTIQNLVTEWAPPNIHTLLGGIFFIGLFGSAIIIAISPKRPSFSQVFAFFIFGYLGLKTSRGIVWFGLIMAPIFAEHLFNIRQKYKKAESTAINPAGSRFLNIVILVAIVMTAAVSLPWFKDALPLPQLKAGLISVETPVQATEMLVEMKPPGQVFNAISFGSYLIWSAYPQYQVFVDSRIELFSEKVWTDYLNISNAYGDWETLLTDYGVNTLMLSPTEQPVLVEAVEASGNWMEIYHDSSAYIFTRK